MSTRHLAGSGRAEILAAATREFADRGYAGATTAGIARLAGVTQPLVHHHFGSKQGLWKAVTEALIQEFHEAMSRAKGEVEGADRVTRLAHLLRASVLFNGSHPEFSRIIRNESSAGGEAFEALFAMLRPGPLSFFQRELSAAVEDGTVQSIDSRHAYFAIIGATNQPFAEPETARRIWGLDVKDERFISQYADLVVSMVLRGLLAAPASPPPPRNAPARKKRPAARKPRRGQD
ncbi:TetR/AcrR family transcriptional regulator [Archangium lansingense]|uniref:TetR family transcriptional regulator n=1 Tax=Archangium lansingense TaxID=2995310 RepID=A0ABT3ZX34_9BACT|nr:TetR/AcrR family transcriptional regulator [Archangium lansinium]MCY1073955.1 TetR family transcriptional regulator [Archangium lansinium]